jgi:hypothetical protein
MREDIKRVNKTLFSFVDTLNKFVSAKLDVVHAKTLITYFFEAYL